MSNNNTRLHRPPIIEIDGEGLTPELKNRVIDLEIKKEEKSLEHEINDNWNCCCMKNRPTDSRMVKYLFQMAIILAIMVLCIVRLADPRTTCETANTFVALLTLLIGVVLPSPSSSKK